MGGRIGLESAVGLGSTFWVEIDLEKQPERAGAAGAASSRGARVLLVGFPPRERERARGGARRLGRDRRSPSPTVEEGVARLVAEISLAKPYHSALLYASGEDLQLAQRFRRAAPNPAPPTILAVPRDADVRRFEVLSSGFAAVLELPFDKRQPVQRAAFGRRRARRCAKAWCGCRTTRAAAAPTRSCACWSPTTIRPTARSSGKILERSGHAVTLVNDGEQALDAIERERARHRDPRPQHAGHGRHGGAAGAAPDDARARAPAGDHAVGRRHAGGEARGARGRRRRLPAKPIEALRLLEEIQALCAAARRRRRARPSRREAASAPRHRGAGRGQRRDARAPRGARLVGRLRREADPRVHSPTAPRILGAHRAGARGARLPRVPLAAARDEGLVGEHGHRPADAPVHEPRQACRTPSCGCRRRRCCARSARSSPRRAAQLERYLAGKDARLGAVSLFVGAVQRARSFRRGEGQQVRLRALDGYELGAVFYAAQGRARRAGSPCCTAAPGIPALRYRRFAAFLAEPGIPALTYDYRGIGLSRPRALRGFAADDRGLGRVRLPRPRSPGCASASRAPRSSASPIRSAACWSAARPMPPSRRRLVLIGGHTGYYGDYRPLYRLPMAVALARG